MTDDMLEPIHEASRFKALLTPIRDITASWGVDVAKHLLEYALTIGITLPDHPDDAVTVDPSASDINSPHFFDFAEAALIVQGSTSIYWLQIVV